jgi:hypothetical protein
MNRLTTIFLIVWLYNLINIRLFFPSFFSSFFLSFRIEDLLITSYYFLLLLITSYYFLLLLITSYYFLLLLITSYYFFITSYYIICRIGASASFFLWLRLFGALALLLRALLLLLRRRRRAQSASLRVPKRPTRERRRCSRCEGYIASFRQS